MRALASLTFLALLLCAVVFAPSGGDGLWVRTLHNFAHGPIFGCVALIALLGPRDALWFATKPAALRYALAFAVAALLGAATELAQVPTGRDASFEDFGHDLLGASVFLLLFAACDRSVHVRVSTKRFVFLLGLIALAALVWPLVSTGVAYARRVNGFPVLADFSHSIGAGFISARLTQIEVVPLPTDGTGASEQKALRIRFLPGRWPGIEFTEPPPDWRGFDTLVFDVLNSEPEELAFVVRIDDEMHNGRFADRYNHEFHVPAGTRTLVKIPLSEIESAPRTRRFDLAEVHRIVVFRSATSTAETMYLVGVRLE
jgi:hypothetical protein